MSGPATMAAHLNKRPLKAAIIGTGRIASKLEKDPLRHKPHTHAGCYAHHPFTELVAGADINAENLAEFGADWRIGSEHLYQDYVAMLRAERPDIVSICAYAPQRQQMVTHALEYGVRGLWLEKAIGCSLAEARTIADAIERAGAKAIVDYPRRSAGTYRFIKDRIEDGRYGRLLSIQVSMNSQMIHTGTHAFDVLNFWCGPVRTLQGWLEDAALQSERIQDGAGYGHLIFANGVHAFINAGRRGYYIFQFDLQFEHARVHIGNDILQLFTPGESKNYTGFKELFLDAAETAAMQSAPAADGLLVDLVACMLDVKRKPVYSVQNAVDALRIGVGLFQSNNQQHRWLKPEEVDADLRIESV